MVLNIFRVLFSHLYILLGEMAVRVFAHLLIGLFDFFNVHFWDFIYSMY